MADFDLARHQGAPTLGIAASIASHVLALAVPLALFQTYDRILPNQAYGTTAVLAIGVSIAIVIEAILRYSRAVLFAYIGWAFESQMTARLLEHLLRADARAVHRLGTSTLTHTLRAVWQVRDFWSGNAAVALHELPFALLYILLIAYIGGWLALIPLLLTTAGLLAALATVRSMTRAVRDVEDAQAARRTLGLGAFNGFVEIKAMAAETLITTRYRAAVARVMDAMARVEIRMALITENGALLGQLATIGVVTAGAFMVVAGELTTGGLAACSLLAGRSLGPAMGAFLYLARRAEKEEAERKIAQALSLPLAPVWKDGTGGDRRPFAGGTVVLSGEILDGGTVSVPQGTFVHIDAPDSLVATRVLRSVARLDDSLPLQVTFDGLPSAAYDPYSLRRGVTKARARAELIRGSLLDNLTLFSPQYEARAIQLAERLGLSAFIDGLRQGYLTPVGPTGAEIVSPGMAARIDLIRALVRQPAILCLDRVDGPLDLDGEKRLVALLKELKGKTTVFIVSTDPALVALADRTIRLVRRKAA